MGQERMWWAGLGGVLMLVMVLGAFGPGARPCNGSPDLLRYVGCGEHSEPHQSSPDAVRYAHRHPTVSFSAEPLVAEWPAQKLVYVADGRRLRVFRMGLGLAPLAERDLPAGRLEALEVEHLTGRVTLVMAKGPVVVDGRSLR